MNSNLGLQQLKILILPIALCFVLGGIKQAYAKAGEDPLIRVLTLTVQSDKSQQAVVQKVHTALRKFSHGLISDQLRFLTQQDLDGQATRSTDFIDCHSRCLRELGSQSQATHVISISLSEIEGHIYVILKLYDVLSGQLDHYEVVSLEPKMEDVAQQKLVDQASKRIVKHLISKTSLRTEATETKVAIPPDSSTKSDREGEEPAEIITQVFRSRPSGAEIWIDGVLHCDEGSELCQIDLPIGRYHVMMTKRGYVTQSQKIEVTKQSQMISWSLKSLLMPIEVTTQPTDLEFTLNGERYVGSGVYQVKRGQVTQITSASPCYEPIDRVIDTTKAHEEFSIKLTPRQRMVTLDLEARSGGGEVLETSVFLSDQRLGTTPGKFKVWACSNSFVLRHEDYGEIRPTFWLNPEDVNQQVITIDHPEVDQMREMRTWVLISGSLALLSLGVSTYGYMKARSLKEDYPSSIDRPQRYQSLREEYDQASLIAQTSLISTTVFTLSTLVLSAYLVEFQSELKTSFSSRSDTPSVPFSWTW